MTSPQNRTELKQAVQKWPKSGEWCWVNRADGTRSAVIGCPDCGQAASLDHTIGPNGDVDPSLVCPLDACRFHEYVRLVGWKAWP